ncbi:MAG: SpoIIE family protein phosphatase [Candidatus Acidiferrales bacterium]
MPKANIEAPDWLRQTERILEEMNEGVAIVDDQLRVVFANEALLRLGQYERDEIEGRTPDTIFPPEDVPYIVQQHESGHRYRHNRNEFYFPRKDGEKIPAIFSGRVIQGPNGREYVILILTDISAQKRVEAQLREANILLEKRQNEMDTELALAARVQQSLAPRSLTWQDIVIEAYYSPAHTIGGDFGVILPQGDEYLKLVMCDVSGHGVGSALMANRIYAEVLHEIEYKTGPGNLLKRLHDFVQSRIPLDGFFFTMAIARFGQRGRHLSLAAAGHPPAMLVSNGEVRLIDSQGGILGCLSETAPSESAKEIDLNSGDRLVFYTDGLEEVFNEHNEMLGLEGLEALVRESSTRALPEMKETILEGVAAWRHGTMADDVSLVIVEVR